MLPTARRVVSVGIPLDDALVAFRRAVVFEGLVKCRGNLSHTAARLGIHRNTLMRDLAGLPSEVRDAVKHLRKKTNPAQRAAAVYFLRELRS
jgi:DNA-binding NtrC family response regulator